MKQITVVTGSFPSSEAGDTPCYLTFDVDEKFFDRTSKIQALLKTNGLTEARFEWWPESWGDTDGLVGQIQLVVCECVVQQCGYMHFSATPENGPSVETPDILLKDLQEEFAKTSPGAVIFLCEKREKQAYLDDSNDC